MQIKFSDIKINSGFDRFARDEGDIDSLALSIAERGLFHPLVIDEDYNLIIGGRRFKALQQVVVNFPTVLSNMKARRSWQDERDGDIVKVMQFTATTVECMINTNMSEVEKKFIELSENIDRQMMSWQEISLARAEIFQLITQLASEGSGLTSVGRDAKGRKGYAINNITLEKVADDLGISTSGLSQSLKLADAMIDHPDIAEETSTGAALARLKREDVQELRRILSDRSAEYVKESVIEGDNGEVLKTLPSDVFSLIITDIPYGADLEAVWADVLNDHITSFDDTDGEASLDHFCSLRDDLYRVMLPTAHMFVFCGFRQLYRLIDHYGEKFSVRGVPLIWDKKNAYCPSSGRTTFGNGYEFLVYMSKGTKLFNFRSTIDPAKGDILSYLRLSTEKLHINMKPPEMMSDIIKLCCRRGEWVLDPYCGSGVVLAEAKRLGCRPYGMDSNPESVVIARQLLDSVNATSTETWVSLPGGG